MKQIDRLIIKEVLGPWVFGVAIFTVLIMAGSFLFQLTDYIVKGVGISTVVELTLLLLPSVMSKTFPMAMLLATLLAFGKMSGDSEIIAMRAAGASLPRIMLPVAIFGCLVSALSFGFTELLVPQTQIRAKVMKEDIKNKIEGSSRRPTSYPIIEDGKLKAQIMATDFSLVERSLRNATIVVYDKDEHPNLTMHVDQLNYQDDKNWRISGGATLQSFDGRAYLKILDEAWPAQVPNLNASPEDILAVNNKDPDAFTMRQIGEQIDKQKQNRNVTKAQVANLEYMYWNKIALPLAALVYALVGAPLGIRNHRAGAAAGFWIAVIIIFSYMLIANVMAIQAQGGLIPAFAASFLPLVLGLGVAGYTIRRKA